MNKKPLFCLLPIEQLHRGRYQPRREFDETSLSELAQSIRSSGLIQPIVVRQKAEHDYEIIAGERRWRAAQIAGLSEISCLINNYSDEQAAAITAIENVQRKNLNPIEEAQSFQRLIDDFNYSHEEVAAVMGQSRSHISNMLRLLRLDEKIQRWLIEGKLSEGHGKILAGLDYSDQIELGQRCLTAGWSVRHLEQQVKKRQTTSELPPTHRADIRRLERLISEKMGTKVTVETDAQAKSGWLNIQFYDNETLTGLLEKMNIKQDD